MINYDLAAQLFGSLYDKIDGYSISHEARRSLGIGDQNDLLYGELPLDTWKEIVQKANPKNDGVFLDVGSGTGRIVISSFLLFDFKKNIGVELLEGLYIKSQELRAVFDKDVLPQIAEHAKNREMQFLCKNIFDTDLREVDFILMNHPFKDREMFDLLEEKFLSELKPKTKIVTTIRALKNPAFKRLGDKKYNFSWGESTAYFHEV